MPTIFGADQDTFFMKMALVQAEHAYMQDEVPVGALIVNNAGTILAQSYNKVEQLHTQCAHAELLALAEAGRACGDWRLLDCWLYVTLQPCAMCMHAIKLHRLSGVVYGAESPLFGYQLDKHQFDSVYKNDIMQVISGVVAEKSEQLLKRFFQQKRKKER